jgi:pantoate--beta-alanine ligase
VIFCKTISDLKSILKDKRASNSSIGFVPTMGALHQGHLSLIENAKQKSDVVVCSIFVNPTQFNQASDLENYPKPIETDLQLLANIHCDIVFMPSVEEMYPDGFEKLNADKLGDITKFYEGSSRPGHFDGVYTVLMKLFDIVEPNMVFFGQKDYQQCLLVKKIIAFHLLPIAFNMCDIMRENDGLAMSSRNIRLNTHERKAAVKLSKALFYLKNNWLKMPETALISDAKSMITDDEILKLEYLECVDAETLLQNEAVKTKVCLLAVNCGGTRLIDNVLLP